MSELPFTKQEAIEAYDAFADLYAGLTKSKKLEFFCEAITIYHFFETVIYSMPDEIYT